MTLNPSVAFIPHPAGWSDLRLLAPRAELRLLLTGGSSLVDSHRLSFLGEALRALLVMETRSLTVSVHAPWPRLYCLRARCGSANTEGSWIIAVTY